MSNRPSTVVISIPKISPASGRYEGRYPQGDKPGNFSIAPHASARYFVDNNANPYPMKGFACWYLLSRSAAEYQTVLQDNLAKGFNTTELKMIMHDPGSNNVPFAGNGAAPFLKTLSGANWNGSLSYSNINNDAPDFTTPNETYWAFIDAFVAYCQANGIVIWAFPCYVGFTTSQEGWRDEMAANGATRMQTYGAFIANRYKSYGNIVWMIEGDSDTSDGDFPVSAENGFITGHKGVAGQASTSYLSEPKGGLATDDTTYGSQVTVNGAYAYFNWTYTGLRGYTTSPTKPMVFVEGTYEGNGQAQLDVAPMRRFYIWNMMSCGAGCMISSYPWWRFNTGYLSQINSPMRVDLARFNSFWDSIPWHRLIPESKGSFTTSIGTLVTAGGGSQDDQTTNDMVTAMATTLGDLGLAYIGPGTGGGSPRPVTMDMTKYRSTVTARFWNPTDGTYTTVPGSPFSNTGTRVFTPPANHSDTFGDWILRLDS